MAHKLASFSKKIYKINIVALSFVFDKILSNYELTRFKKSRLANYRQTV